MVELFFFLQHTVQTGNLPYASGAAGGMQNGDHLANPAGVSLQQLKVEKDVGQTFTTTATGVSVGSQAVEQQTVIFPFKCRGLPRAIYKDGAMQTWMLCSDRENKNML